MQTEIIKNIEKIRERINSACSKVDIEPRNLTLVAVSKKKSHELIKIALQNGDLRVAKETIKKLDPEQAASENKNKVA